MKNSMIKVVRPDIRQFVINELYLIALLVIGGALLWIGRYALGRFTEGYLSVIGSVFGV